jgi:hypothetical protein
LTVPSFLRLSNGLPTVLIDLFPLGQIHILVPLLNAVDLDLRRVEDENVTAMLLASV